jgi:hypothetical protein
MAWFRQLLRLLPSENRAFVWAMMPSLAIYSVSDNVLALVAALGIFVYFGILLDARHELDESGRRLRDRGFR